MTPQKSTRCNVTSLDKNNKMNNATLDFLNTLKLNTNPKQAQTVLQQAMEQFSTYTGNNNAGKSWKKCFFFAVIDCKHRLDKKNKKMSSNTTVHKHQTGSGYTFQQKSEMLSILLREQIITNEHQQYQQIRQILKDLKQSNILSFDVQLGQKINSNINKKELKKI